MISTTHVENTAQAEDFGLIDEMGELMGPKQTQAVADEFYEPSQTETHVDEHCNSMIEEMNSELTRQNALLKERLS
jgi:hypothetical protein